MNVSLTPEMERLVAEIQVGVNELARGDVVPMEEAFAEAWERIAAYRRLG